jgi:hypothetical protein
MSTQLEANRTFTIPELIERQSIEIAIDTEYKGIHTLTIQAAARIGPDEIAVQVYRSPAIPRLPENFDLTFYLPAPHESYDRSGARVVLRPVRKINPSLSPVRIVRDLLQIANLKPIEVHEGRRRLESENSVDFPRNAIWCNRTGRWVIPSLRLVFVGHFLPADFGRIFGRDFYDTLLRPAPGFPDSLVIRDGNLIGLVRPGRSATFAPPIVQYALDQDALLYKVQLETRDTNLPFGPSSLDRHSRTFLGVGKSALAEKDKVDMLRTFHDQTARAYGYAIVDAVNTLLVHEQMKEQDRNVYRAFGCSDGEIPPMRSTQGSRVATFLIRMTQRSTASGSTILKNERSLKTLMKKGGRGNLSSDRGASRFGEQTGRSHGGLLLSRTPTRFWHEAPGMIRDVDMSACYSGIIASMNVYWGRPVVYEPGSRLLPLRDAVDLVNRLAAPDSWYIRVTGDIAAGFNVLIPSTLDAITSQNYSQRRRKPAGAAAKLFSKRIESGIVTQATWLMIQAMPTGLRRDFENLTADSIVFYPGKLVASDGQSFDRLAQKYQTATLPWETELDLETMRETVVERLDADYVGLAFPIGECARRIGEFRKEAQQEHGKDSGADATWKQQANTMYGVLACPHLPTNNAVAANQITATARAEGYAMILALNGLQLITDGCTYRRDQIPACTFAECLRIQPDYPLRRAEDDCGIPFLDPDDIPIDDEEFTTWYRKHVLRFFAIDGPKFEALFRIHNLVHKQNGSSHSFDALACDGGGNYLKCQASDDGGWEVQEMKMRGYGSASKEALKAWILSTYPSDHVMTLPPLTQDEVLLKVKEAQAKVRAAFTRGLASVALPLGLPCRKVRAHKAIKLSAFIFETPKQYRLLAKQVQRFETKTACGLEVLAFRRSYGDRHEPSLHAIAESMYSYIQEGGHDLTKHLHLNRSFPALADAGNARREQITQMRASADDALLAMINPQELDPAALTSAIVCRADVRQPG